MSKIKCCTELLPRTKNEYMKRIISSGYLNTVWFLGSIFSAGIAISELIVILSSFTFICYNFLALIYLPLFFFVTFYLFIIFLRIPEWLISRAFSFSYSYMIFIFSLRDFFITWVKCVPEYTEISCHNFLFQICLTFESLQDTAGR